MSAIQKLLLRFSNGVMLAALVTAPASFVFALSGHTLPAIVVGGLAGALLYLWYTAGLKFSTARYLHRMRRVALDLVDGLKIVAQRIDATSVERSREQGEVAEYYVALKSCYAKALESIQRTDPPSELALAHSRTIERFEGLVQASGDVVRANDAGSQVDAEEAVERIEKLTNELNDEFP